MKTPVGNIKPVWLAIVPVGVLIAGQLSVTVPRMVIEARDASLPQAFDCSTSFGSASAVRTGDETKLSIFNPDGSQLYEATGLYTQRKAIDDAKKFCDGQSTYPQVAEILHRNPYTTSKKDNDSIHRSYACRGLSGDAYVASTEKNQFTIVYGADATSTAGPLKYAIQKAYNYCTVGVRSAPV